MLTLMNAYTLSECMELTADAIATREAKGEKNKETRCLTKKKYSLEFYFMLYKVKDWGLRSFNAKHEKNFKVS